MPVGERKKEKKEVNKRGEKERKKDVCQRTGVTHTHTHLDDLEVVGEKTET
jgi:hypothetical protein